eukprot:m.110228 g.110228  ORF g.110228 m.110228 type:complete len:405 (+) comp12880_c0_seq2:123-1337(+)
MTSRAADVAAVATPVPVCVQAVPLVYAGQVEQGPAFPQEVKVEEETSAEREPRQCVRDLPLALPELDRSLVESPEPLQCHQPFELSQAPVVERLRGSSETFTLSAPPVVAGHSSGGHAIETARQRSQPQQKYTSAQFTLSAPPQVPGVSTIDATVQKNWASSKVAPHSLSVQPGSRESAEKTQSISDRENASVVVPQPRENGAPPQVINKLSRTPPREASTVRQAHDDIKPTQTPANSAPAADEGNSDELAGREVEHVGTVTTVVEGDALDEPPLTLLTLSQSRREPDAHAPTSATESRTLATKSTAVSATTPTAVAEEVAVPEQATMDEVARVEVAVVSGELNLAVEVTDEAQSRIKDIGICPHRFPWLRAKGGNCGRCGKSFIGGYRCAGGSHMLCRGCVGQ